MPKYHSKPWKPYRNDPCPCESGRKHKHCCLPNEKRKLYKMYLDFRKRFNFKVTDREIKEADYQRKARIQTHKMAKCNYF